MAGEWPPAHTDLLRAIWPEGLTATQAARRIQEAFPEARYTRNAVIGKVHRIGLPRQSHAAGLEANRLTSKLTRAISRKPKAKLRLVGPAVYEADAPRKPLRAIKESVWQALPGSSPRPFTERPPGGCRWPIGDEALSCCLPASHGPYCAVHGAIGYTASKTGAKELVRSLRRVA